MELFNRFHVVLHRSDANSEIDWTVFPLLDMIWSTSGHILAVSFTSAPLAKTTTGCSPPASSGLANAAVGEEYMTFIAAIGIPSLVSAS